MISISYWKSLTFLLKILMKIGCFNPINSNTNVNINCDWGCQSWSEWREVKNVRMCQDSEAETMDLLGITENTHCYRILPQSGVAQLVEGQLFKNFLIFLKTNCQALGSYWSSKLEMYHCLPSYLIDSDFYLSFLKI